MTIIFHDNIILILHQTAIIEGELHSFARKGFSAQLISQLYSFFSSNVGIALRDIRRGNSLIKNDLKKAELITCCLCLDDCCVSLTR